MQGTFEDDGSARATVASCGVPNVNTVVAATASIAARGTNRIWFLRSLVAIGSGSIWLAASRNPEEERRLVLYRPWSSLFTGWPPKVPASSRN